MSEIRKNRESSVSGEFLSEILLRCDLFRKRIDQKNVFLKQQITELH